VEGIGVPNLCDNCGESVHRTRFTGGKFIGIDCRCFREQQIKSAVNPFSDLTLEHIHDESGNKVRVTSLRQLQEAEKRFNFASAVANFDESHVNYAPQQKVFSVADMYKSKFHGRRSQ
jgi:hypothetical protein